ncbi:MAG: NADH-quinone oxidoreductase subunit N [Bacteroidetes bacterium]|nr:NADH-quinone oxidoreductase subunit N [Bacteroidota bacterium]MBK8585503.1 NADH-quinone oxidoreductase subunit N [Bacteroidota bacterium]MBP9789299.1 NADH-quinone oxidoreductase subunit N [Bacteroidia bacterium]
MNTLLVLAGIGVFGLFSEIFRFKKALLPVVFLGLAAALVTTVCDWNTNVSYFNNMMKVDNFSLAFSAVMICITMLWFIISPGFFTDETSKSDHFTLILFALTGGVLMSSFNNMVMLFLGIEILSISMYILAGSNKKSLASNEAAFKYFLMGSFATGFLLFGIALIYGATGSFDIDVIATRLSEGNLNSSVMLFAGILLTMIAMAFKVSAAPFHFWAPDVYQGAPTVITAFMSTVVKTAAVAAFFRLFIHTFTSMTEVWHTALMIISAATILVGNITAVYQTNVKRMLAYSSIAHAGYMLMAIVSMNSAAPSALLFYVIAYSVSSIASFTILLMVSNSTGNDSIESFYGLGKKNPFLAIMTLISMLSLAGIPPTAGFFAKYYIFIAAMENHMMPLVLIAVLGSLIGVYYYFRVIIAMFRDGNEKEIDFSGRYKLVMIIAGILALALGVAPGIVTGLL